MKEHRKKPKKSNQPVPTNALIKSFKEYCEAIRKIKPIFTRFKDGNLIKSALNHLSALQIEMLFVWFLKRERKMQPTIGAALCKEVIADFINASHKEYGFYGNLEQLAKQYVNAATSGEKIKTETGKMAEALEKLKAELSKKFRPFSHAVRTQIMEEASAAERKRKNF